MTKRKYYPSTEMATFSVDNLYEAAALLLIDRAELGVLNVEKEGGKLWITYEIKYPASMKEEIERAHKDYRKRQLMVNAKEFQSKLEYIRHLRKKKIKVFKLHREENNERS